MCACLYCRFLTKKFHDFETWSMFNIELFFYDFIIFDQCFHCFSIPLQAYFMLVLSFSIEMLLLLFPAGHFWLFILPSRSQGLSILLFSSIIQAMLNGPSILSVFFLYLIWNIWRHLMLYHGFYEEDQLLYTLNYFLLSMFLCNTNKSFTKFYWFNDEDQPFMIFIFQRLSKINVRRADLREISYQQS